MVAVGCGGGSGGGGEETHSGGSTSWVLRWNHAALDAAGIDHSTGGGPHLGPTRLSRALAIVHIAIFDAVNAIHGGYRSYALPDRAPDDTDMKAAISQAAHDALVALYPAQAASFNGKLSEDLAAIADGPAKDGGIALGRKAARAILEVREGDGSRTTLDYAFGPNPGEWRHDPLHPGQRASDPGWKNVIPFALGSADQFRAPPPPALGSAEYAEAFDEVKRLGGDGVVTATERTEDQTVAGIYWGYDVRPGIASPPRLYNQIAVQIAQDRGSDVVELARLLALANIAMADAGISSWESKYHYNFWRPVAGIREADAGTGPTGLGDGNDSTLGDPGFTPLGAPYSNSLGLNFTPPFPAYPSGHATFGAAMFETLRNFYGTDDISFTFVSNEFDGVTTDNFGQVRPHIPRTFRNLAQAEEENGQSRIYLGIHWSFDKIEGIALGRKVGDYVFENVLTPVH